MTSDLKYSLTHTFVISLMSYITMSQYSFKELVEQCLQAVNSCSSDTQDSTDLYAEVRKYYHYDDNAGQVFRMKDYGSLIR